MANINVENNVGKRSNHAITPRERSRMAFYHHGMKVCMATFMKLHGIGKYCHNVTTENGNVP